jgi:pre-mRNA-splicing factor CDC5/CEF1
LLTKSLDADVPLEKNVPSGFFDTTEELETNEKQREAFDPKKQQLHKKIKARRSATRKMTSQEGWQRHMRKLRRCRGFARPNRAASAARSCFRRRRLAKPS